MNDEQKKVFYEVMRKVEETHKFKARQEKARDDQLKGSTEEVPTDGPGQLLKFVSGEGEYFLKLFIKSYHKKISETRNRKSK